MSDTNFPTFRLAGHMFFRLVRWLFSWRAIRRVLITLAVLITVVALAWTEENVRGKWAWNRYKSQLEAKGEKLDFKDFVPPKVPDDQNFAMTPMLAGLYEFTRKPGSRWWDDTNAWHRAQIIYWSGNLSNPIPRMAPGHLASAGSPNLNAWASFFRGATNSALSLPQKEAAQEVLDGMNKFQSQMDELQSASRRPFSRFNIAYDTPDPMEILLPHLATLKMEAIVFQAHAFAEIALSNTQAALTDTETLLNLANALKSEPLEISHLVRISILKLGLESVWTGLSEHKWSDAQLAGLQEQLTLFDFIADYEKVLRAERAAVVEAIEYFRTHRMDDEIAVFIGRCFMPSGWYNQNKVTVARIITDRILPYIDPAAHWIRPERIPTAEILSREAGRFHPFQGLALIMLGLPEGDAVPITFASAQTVTDQATIACALERFRLKNGNYPESLSALQPEFLRTIPNDVIGGKPLIYRRHSDGSFILYSIGWNNKDDGGTTAVSGKDSLQNFKEGDWVWPEYPSN